MSKELHIDSGASPADIIAKLPKAGGTMTGDLVLYSGAPATAASAAPKSYVDTVAQGLSPKPSAIVATAAALPAYAYANGTAGVGATLTASANGVLTVDGRSCVLNDVILVKDETAGNAPYNGLYILTTAGTASVKYVLTRHTSMDTTLEFAGGYVFAIAGTANTGSGFVCLNTGAVTVGTTAITFTQFTALGEVTAGNGLSKSANTLSIDTSITVDKTTAQTLTNKRMTKRVVSLADATSFTLSADTADVNTQANTQGVGTLTANAPSGTPTDGQPIVFRIKSTAVQTYSWNAIFRGSVSVPLPTTSSGASLTDYLGFIYNAADSKWDIVAYTAGF